MPQKKKILLKNPHPLEYQDPSKYASIEDLRRELEESTGARPMSITRAINWLAAAANSGGDDPSRGTLHTMGLRAYKWVLGLDAFLPASQGNGASASGTATGAGAQAWCLDELEARVGADRVSKLQAVLLGSRTSTLKLIRRHPAVLEMEDGTLFRRMVSLKTAFPGCDVAVMVERLPSAFLTGDWETTLKQVAGAGELLKEGLPGAEMERAWEEDPTILFEDLESLEVGLKRLKELWPSAGRITFANSDPDELALAVRALGLRGPPKGV
jgi:hypothetical protein